MNFDSNGDVQRFWYNSSVARSELARLIARLDLPLNICEQPTWKDYIRIARNHNYKHVSRQLRLEVSRHCFILSKLMQINC
jgi:hypothetical protein